MFIGHFDWIRENIKFVPINFYWFDLFRVFLKNFKIQIGATLFEIVAQSIIKNDFEIILFKIYKTVYRVTLCI